MNICTVCLYPKDYTNEEKRETDANRPRAFLFDSYSRCCAKG